MEKIKGFNPPFSYPLETLQVIKASLLRCPQVVMQKKAIRTTDKETIYLSYYPLSFERLPNNIPIVFFLVGIFGGTYAYYS